MSAMSFEPGTALTLVLTNIRGLFLNGPLAGLAERTSGRFPADHPIRSEAGKIGLEIIAENTQAILGQLKLKPWWADVGANFVGETLKTFTNFVAADLGHTLSGAQQANVAATKAADATLTPEQALEARLAKVFAEVAESIKQNPGTPEEIAATKGRLDLLLDFAFGLERIRREFLPVATPAPVPAPPAPATPKTLHDAAYWEKVRADLHRKLDEWWQELDNAAGKAAVHVDAFADWLLDHPLVDPNPPNAVWAAIVEIGKAITFQPRRRGARLRQLARNTRPVRRAPRRA